MIVISNLSRLSRVILVVLGLFHKPLQNGACIILASSLNRYEAIKIYNFGL